MHSTSLSLLRRLQDKGEAADWRRLVELMTPLLAIWSQRLGVVGADADDLVQDTLLTLFQRIGEFQHHGPGSFRGWVHVVLINKRRDHLRRRMPQVGLDELADGLMTDAIVVGDDEFRNHLCARALRLLQRDYEPTTWAGFWQTVVEGRSAKSVARELGITPNAIYLARGRILARLRIELSDLIE